MSLSSGGRPNVEPSRHSATEWRRYGEGADQLGPDRAGRVRRAHGALPAGAAGALLPDARLVPGRRGPGPGDAAAGLAAPTAVPGPRQLPRLVVPDRHQRLPGRPGQPFAAGPALSAGARHRSTGDLAV